jgi:hypothetical protein
VRARAATKAADRGREGRRWLHAPPMTSGVRQPVTPSICVPFASRAVGSAYGLASGLLAMISIAVGGHHFRPTDVR